MTRSIVHPRLMERLGPHFQKQTCTIQVNTPTQTSSGASVPDWNDLPDHVDLTCTIAPITASERRQINMTVADATHLVGLDGYYPLILAEHSIVSDGQRYDVTGVEHGSQHALTQLRVRAVSL